MATHEQRPNAAADPDPGSFQGRSPQSAAWVRDGWIAVGRDDSSRSFVRALDSGGMVVAGTPDDASVDDALGDLDAGRAARLTERG